MKDLWVVTTRRAPVQKRHRRSTLNFTHTILAAQKCARNFSNNELFSSVTFKFMYVCSVKKIA